MPVLKNGIALILSLVFIFTLSIISYFILQNDYFRSSEINYTQSIKSEIKSEIKTQKNDILLLAKNLANNIELIDIMNSGRFQDLYTNDIFDVSTGYFHFEKIKINIVDKSGIKRYSSQKLEKSGKNILKHRKNLASLLKKPKPSIGINRDKSGIGFRGIMPIYNKKHTFLGIVEVISSFHSIFEELQNNRVHSAIVINKKFTDSKKNYIESNQDFKKEFAKLIKKYKIDYFIKIKTYDFVSKVDKLVDGYYVINILIYNSKNEKIANYLAFVYDRFELAQKGIALLAMIILMGIIFIITAGLVFKKHKEGLENILNLDKEVKNQINEKLKLLYVDLTTGAYRKIKFKEDLKKQRERKVVIMDIRNFSKINEAYGFDIGDLILRICVQRIENLLNRKIYRINSDEFSFFSDEHKKEIRAIKHEFINDSIKIIGGTINLRISFSCGVVKASEEKLLSKMSIAVKEAKRHPFSDFILYKNKNINDDFLKYNSLLYDAIFLQQQAELIPYFQGIRDNKTGGITKYEALARIKTKDKVYTPYLFIEIAKNSGFLHEITKIMIKKSCRYISLMDKSIEISINITEDDLFTHKLGEYFLEILKKYDINSNRITLEVLEGITTSGAKNNIKQLKKLKDAGFKIAIDDFGVEYSNFERISELDIDFIKIDKKYISTIHTNPKSLKIAKTINDFAHSLGIKVVAEFVESEEIQKSVDMLGIEYSQGYLFSHPREFI